MEGSAAAETLAWSSGAGSGASGQWTNRKGLAPIYRGTARRSLAQPPVTRKSDAIQVLLPVTISQPIPSAEPYRKNASINPNNGSELCQLQPMDGESASVRERTVRGLNQRLRMSSWPW